MIAYVYRYEAESVSFDDLNGLNRKLAEHASISWVRLAEDGQLLSEETELDTADLDFFEGAAALIARHLRRGHIRIIFKDEEGFLWGFDIYPNLVETLRLDFVPDGRIDLEEAIEELWH